MMMEHTFPPEFEAGRLGVLVRLVREMEREQIEAAVEGLIGLLDASDGDPDLEQIDEREPNGDERDTGNAEDELLTDCFAKLDTGPGCPLSDPGGTGDRYDGEDDEADGDQIRGVYRRRLQETRCDRILRFGGRPELGHRYQLRERDAGRLVTAGALTEIRP